MPSELLIYALVAAGLVFWLRSVLGTRHGEERPRPDPFISVDLEIKDEAPIGGESAKAETQADTIRTLAQNPHKVYSIKDSEAEKGLIEIAGADRNFDVHFFAEGAQDAFVMIVESFADGDREALQGLLGDDVYNAFDAAIAEREEKGHTQLTDIHAIRKAEIIEAGLDARDARITVKFIAEESSAVKDEAGEIISGHPDKVAQMRDIWVFSRDVKSKNPAWRVVETRGGFEDDNDLVPDTH